MEAKERDARSLSRLTSPPLRTATPSRSRTAYNAPDAALTGALLAFNKPSTVTTTASRQHAAVTKLRDGALSAAKSVQDNRLGRSDPPPPPALTRTSSTASSTDAAFLDGNKENTVGRLKLTSTGTSAASVSASESARSSSRSSTPVQQLGRPVVHRSESLTAATLATARSQRSSPSRTPSRTTSPPLLDSRALALQRRLNERMIARELYGSMDNAHEKTDLAPIEPTKSLVKMFEQHSSASSMNTPTLIRQPSLAKGKPPPIVAPKPQRTLSVQSVSPELRRPDVPVKPKPVIPAAKKEPINTTHITQSEPAAKPQPSKPSLPPPLRGGVATGGGRGGSGSTEGAAVASKPLANTDTRSTESAPPLSRFGLPEPKPISRPPSVTPSLHVLPSNHRRKSPAPYKDTSLSMLSPHMTGDSLANAMVGANLAIKSTSPPKHSHTPPPVPPSRRKHHAHDVFGHSRARSLSPQKKQPGKLLTTLRGDDVEEKEKNRKHHFRQPNKHHEGTRERWRDYVSDSERKRYEGVWAANKGLYMTSPDQADEVLNIVARDIWSRSRLSNERLGMVWNLVTADENGRSSLTREQFVVGMWLIDQMLKGRNLPHSVNASVWTSVRLMGVKVRLEGKGKDGRKLERGTVW